MASQKLQAERASLVTPSNTVNIPSISGGVSNGCVLYVGTGGDLAVVTVGGDSVVFANVQDGSFLPIQVLRVLVTGTNASDIIALW
jgi:hypothetical protein